MSIKISKFLTHSLAYIHPRQYTSPHYLVLCVLFSWPILLFLVNWACRGLCQQEVRVQWSPLHESCSYNQWFFYASGAGKSSIPTLKNVQLSCTYYCVLSIEFLHDSRCFRLTVERLTHRTLKLILITSVYLFWYIAQHDLPKGKSTHV